MKTYQRGFMGDSEAIGSVLRAKVRKLLPTAAKEARRAVRNESNNYPHGLRPVEPDRRRYGSRVQMGTGHVRSEGHLRPKPPVLFRGEPM